MDETEPLVQYDCSTQTRSTIHFDVPHQALAAKTRRSPSVNIAPVAAVIDEDGTTEISINLADGLPVVGPLLLESEPAAIQLGFGSVIPRWNVQDSSRKLRYFIDGSTFPKDEKFDFARHAAEQVEIAGKAWNSLNLGISFVNVADENVANFKVIFADQVGVSPTVCARAFFPNEADMNCVKIFEYCYSKEMRYSMHNVLTHEFGHILGLRHEFSSPTRAAKEKPSTQFMQANSMSIMSGNSPPILQESDREGTIAFYRYTDLTIGGVPIHDYMPKDKAK